MIIYGVDALNDVTGEQRVALFSTPEKAIAWGDLFDSAEWDLVPFWQELDNPEQPVGSIH